MFRMHSEKPNFPVARLLAMLTLLGLAVWLAAVASAQAAVGTICGKVVDHDGRPVTTAIVTIQAVGVTQPLKSPVDSNGEFCFTGLATGSYTVTVWDATGAQALYQTSAAVSASKTTRLSAIYLAKAKGDGTDQPQVEVNEPAGGGKLNQTVLGDATTRDPASGTFGANLNSEVIEEIEVVTTAPAAEYGRAYGGYVNQAPGKKEGEKRKDARGSGAAMPKSAPTKTAETYAGVVGLPAPPPERYRQQSEDGNTEAYSSITESNFKRAGDEPLSTFSIDVDTASFSNVRRYLGYGQLPPADAVRLEELINYFTYDYAPPANGRPFAVHVDAARCPWEPEHLLVRIGLKGREVPRNQIPACNLVFLIDVSGSMQDPNKLPLVIEGLTGLANELRPQDSVAIVVYAGSSGVVLPSTHDKAAVIGALSRLAAGGSTNGAEGIRLAYQIAAENFREGGVNRVILATDGDFNVGTTSEGELVKLITEKARTGVFLNVLGFGVGNLKDSTMEQLADKGNGMYAYIDTAREARRVLVQQMAGTLYTIAKDVKIQCEFNPAEVAGWRLLGYENRILAHEDFNDDRKDAGEIGAGHTVTALYEIVPFGKALPGPGVDPLKYQAARTTEKNGEWLTVKLRYKEPDGSVSKLLEEPFSGPAPEIRNASPDLRFAAAVASFGMMLRGSEHRGTTSFGDITSWASTARGADRDGARNEFLELVRRAQELKGSAQVTENR